MCATVLYITLIFCAMRLNHAAEQQNPSGFRISTTSANQGFPLVSGSELTLFKFYDIADASPGHCNGTCYILNTSHVEQIDGEDCNVYLQNGVAEMNVIIKTAVSDSFIGIWRCTLKTPSVYSPGAMSIQSAEFRVFVTPTKWSPELPKTPSGSFVSVNVPSTRTANVSLQTEETLLLNVTGTSDYQNYRICDIICEISSQNPVKSKSCTVHETNILATLESKIAYKGLWSCTVKLKQIQPESRQENGNDDQPLSIHFTLNISVKESAPTTSLSSDQIIIIAIAVSTIVGIIIIGQTICIIHFKKKARRALIDKHLTPKNTINEGSSTDRYVNKKSGKESGKGETDEGIYEALESTRDEPPPLPSLATLPVTPKPQHLMRSASQSNLLGAEASTTPRPSRNHQNPGRFNTVARSCSLERIKKRPPQPLPTESSIYEDVTPEKISPTKHKFFGVKSSPVGPKTGPVPMSSNRPVPGKPSPAFPDRQDFLKPQGLNVGRPPIANKFPPGAKPEGSIPLPSVISGAKPMAAMPMLPVGPGAKPMGGVPLLPSMISAAKLKPVNKTKPPPPPVTERPRHPQALSPPSTIAKPYKPKPSVPLPEPVREEPEPIPEDFESVISDDSDDEFKCYDVLPDYTIYGNGAY